MQKKFWNFGYTYIILLGNKQIHILYEFTRNFAFSKKFVLVNEVIASTLNFTEVKYYTSRIQMYFKAPGIILL